MAEPRFGKRPAKRVRSKNQPTDANASLTPDLFAVPLDRKTEAEQFPYQLMPELSSEAYEALKADIAVRGVLVSIEVDEEGHILDGHHRMRACKELGITQYPVMVRKGMSDAQKRTHVRTLNAVRRHLTSQQKRVIIVEQLLDTPESSDRSIAAAIGVSHRTVAAVREALVSGGQFVHLARVVGADGKTYPASAPAARPAVDPANPIAMMHVYGEIACRIPGEHVSAIVLLPDKDGGRYKCAYLNCDPNRPCVDFIKRWTPIRSDVDDLMESLSIFVKACLLGGFLDMHDVKAFHEAVKNVEMPDLSALHWYPTGGDMYYKLAFGVDE